jgi:diguanylate cyclase (GGDEF)-like protein/PAS domain S-box-containing protein
VPPTPSALHRAVLDQIHEGVLLVDSAGLVIDANAAALAQCATAPVGRPFEDVVGDEALDADVEVRPLDDEHRVVIITPPPPERIALTGILEQIPASIIRLAADLTIVNVSNLWLLATGLDRNDVIGTHLHDIPFSERVRAELLPLVDTVVRSERRAGIELLVPTMLGLRWVEFVFVVERDAHGAVTHVIGVSNDVTHRKNRELSLSMEAATDPLTGVLNRSGLNAELRERAAHEGWTGTTLLVIDLDDFKHINDTHGHSTGDQVLVEVAHRIRTAAADGKPVARLGGDEFVVLDGRSGGGSGLADAIQAAFETPIVTDKGSFHLRLSIGVAEVRSPGDEVPDLFNRADEAMYRAKRTGAGTIVDGG